MRYASVPVTSESYTPPVAMKTKSEDEDSVSTNPSVEVLQVTKPEPDPVVSSAMSLIKLGTDLTGDVLGHKVDEQTQRSFDGSGIEETFSTKSETGDSVCDPLICQGCGNKSDMCHQVLFGTLLLQHILSLYKKMSGVGVTEDLIEKTFCEKYNVHLQGYVQLEHGLYDEKEDYKLPVCLVEGALREAKSIVKAKDTLFYLERKRGYAITHRFFTFTNDVTEIDPLSQE